tara:strand:- start:1656 stop:1910 length:255 start_codon:yes stop_codon:yes gene_type:complete
MKKPTNKELIELIARNVLDILKRLEEVEKSSQNNEQILMFLEDVFNPPRDIIKSEEEMVAFSKELYRQICEYCGKDGISFMGIA